MVQDPDTPQARGDAAAAIPADGPGSGRIGLDQRRIIGAAIRFIDDNGLRMLTMQRDGLHARSRGVGSSAAWSGSSRS